MIENIISDIIVYGLKHVFTHYKKRLEMAESEELVKEPRKQIFSIRLLWRSNKQTT